MICGCPINILQPRFIVFASKYFVLPELKHLNVESFNPSCILAETKIQSIPSQKVVGCILLTIDPEDPSGLTYRIRQMAVAPDQQGKGIGSILVEKAEKFSKEDGKNRIYLHGRTSALDFYLKMGYKIISEEFMKLETLPHFALEKELS